MLLLLRAGSHALLVSVVLLVPLRTETAEHEAPLFKVRYGDREVTFSGVIPSEEAGEGLARAAQRARPDLAIANAGLRVDPEVPFPPQRDLESLVTELGISAHEGGLQFDEGEFRIFGLTDSAITVSALLVRLDPIVGRRQVLNHICIVPSEDLPRATVALSRGQSSEPLLDFDPALTAETAFVAPGFPLQKLAGLVNFASDMRRLEGLPPLQAEPLRGPVSATEPAGGLRAMPLTLATPASGESPENGEPDLSGAPFGGTDPGLVRLDIPILFTRSTGLLQANQEPSFDRILSILNAPEWKGQPVTIRAHKSKDGPSTFQDWLCDRRTTEVKRRLIARGIDPALLTTEVRDVNETQDRGEVVLLVEKPAMVVEGEENPPREAPADEVAVADGGEPAGSAAQDPTPDDPPSPATSQPVEPRP